MSYQMREDSTVQAMMDYVDQVTAALMAQSETEKLAEAWDSFQQGLIAALDAQRQDERAVLRTSARVRVHDARWDTALTQLSGETFHHSGKDAKKKPYAHLFKTPARRAVQFGGNRALTYGDELLHQAAALDHPGLHHVLAAFETANRALKDAISARTDATRSLRAHAIRRGELQDDLQDLVDRTEVEILKLYPGDDALVRAILSPDAVRRGVVEPVDAPEAETPEPPADPA